MKKNFGENLETAKPSHNEQGTDSSREGRAGELGEYA